MSLQTADHHFSKFIRLRDGKCFICGSGEDLTCGHFVKRRHLKTRYDEMNCHALCFRCNNGEESDTGIAYQHERKMIEKYGQASVDNLKLRSRQPFHMSKADLNEIAKTYRKKTKEYETV